MLLISPWSCLARPNWNCGNFSFINLTSFSNRAGDFSHQFNRVSSRCFKRSICSSFSLRNLLANNSSEVMVAFWVPSTNSLQQIKGLWSQTFYLFVILFYFYLKWVIHTCPFFFINLLH